MLQREVTIQNKLGLHARPASKLVQLAKRFPCDVHITKDGIRVNGKSIMGVLMLAAGQGTTLTIEASGDQSEEALEQLVSLIRKRFGEE